MSLFVNLGEIYLQQNAFSGTIPSDFTLRLRRLDISRNILSGSIPAEMFRIPYLDLFGASLNCLSKKLPDSICQATTLQRLYLDGLDAGERYVFAT